MKKIRKIICLWPHALVFRWILLMALIPFAIPTAHACTCGDISPCQAYASASTVFVGLAVKTSTAMVKGSLPPQAISTTLMSHADSVQFRVKEVFLGVRESEIVISGGGTSCDYPFKVGQEYLVYAYHGADGRTLYTNICSRTAPLTEAALDLVYLRGITKSPSGSAVSGTVRREGYSAKRDGPTSEPIARARVIFESTNGSFTGITDGTGSFELQGLPMGRYKVSTDPKTNYSSESGYRGEPREDWEIDLTGHGCATMWFSARPVGEISGQVIDQTGKVKRFPDMELNPADPKMTQYNNHTAVVNGEGRYKFTFLPRGRYYLGFFYGPSLELPYPEFYYPGVSERSRAEILELKDNQKLSGVNLRLPPPLFLRRIEGVAVFPNGQPAAGIPIVLINSKHGYQEGNSVLTDALGGFAIEAVEGQTYRLSALIRKGVPLVRSMPIEVKAGEGNNPVTLIVKLP